MLAECCGWKWTCPSSLTHSVIARPLSIHIHTVVCNCSGVSYGIVICQLRNRPRVDLHGVVETVLVFTRELYQWARTKVRPVTITPSSPDTSPPVHTQLISNVFLLCGTNPKLTLLTFSRWRCTGARRLRSLSRISPNNWIDGDDFVHDYHMTFVKGRGFFLTYE